MKKAVIYARVSSKKQERDGTIESQIAALKKQVAVTGDVLVKEYIDNGYSGAKLDRPALNQLRLDIKTDMFDVVYFHNTDRIAREVTYQTIIVGEILKQNKQVIINGRDYVENPENKFTLTVLGAVAELERAKIIERYSRGRMYKIRQGQLISSGSRTFGYDYVPRGSKPGHHVINEREAAVVRLIFKMYAEDEASKSKIIRYLEDNNIATKTGGMWEWKTIDNILKNHSYIGIKYFNTRTIVRELSNPIRKTKYGKEVFKDKSEWLPVKVPAIILPELFEKAQQRFEHNRQRYINPQEVQLLSNLIKCGECGGSFTGYKRFVRGYRYDKVQQKNIADGRIYHRVSYVCSRRIRQEIHSKQSKIKRCTNPQIYTHRLETCVLSTIESVICHENILKKHLIGYKPSETLAKSQAQERLGGIEMTISNLMNLKKRVIELYANGKIDQAEYRKRCRAHDEEIAERKVARTGILQSVSALHQRNVIETSLEKYCNDLTARYKSSDEFSSRRQLVLDYIQRIVFSRGKVAVYGSVPILLEAYADHDQTSNARQINFEICSVVEER